MRKLFISISPRASTEDNSYIFNSADSIDPMSTYQFSEMTLNYSITTSSATSTLVLSMNAPVNNNNVLRSGQPIYIEDNGSRVFEGVLLTCHYRVDQVQPNGTGGVHLFIVLAPSIYQLTISPMIFDTKQASQIQNLLNVDVTSVLAANVAQAVPTQDFLDYIISNTDYANIFQGTIDAQELGDQLYVMAEAGQFRDSVLRSSINYYNCVFYQDEAGKLLIRQLTSNDVAPFSLDLTNASLNDGFIPTNSDNVKPVVPMLMYDYTDNAYNTPCVVSNYNIISADISISAKVDELILSYAPNPDYYPRLKQLQNSGWFVGQIGRTQINQNLVTDPTAATALSQATSNPDQYMQSLSTDNVTSKPFAAYQALLTGKQLANALTGYSALNGVVSLDDKNLEQNTGSIIGKVVGIANCDMFAGVIASCSRSYSASGSYLAFNIAPLGSITGFWKG